MTDEPSDHGVPQDRAIPAEVHQAEGALSARRGISVAEAAESLRAIARCAGTPLIDVARHVLGDGPGPDRD